MFALFAARTTATSPRSLTSARISSTICQMLSRTNLSMWWVLFLSLSACLHTIKTPWLKLHYWALTGYRGFTPQYVNVWVCVWMRKQETEAGNTSRFVRQIQQGKVGLKCFWKRDIMVWTTQTVCKSHTSRKVLKETVILKLCVLLGEASLEWGRTGKLQSAKEQAHDDLPASFTLRVVWLCFSIPSV